MKTTIFCFSGSGNSYWVANQLAQLIPDCELRMIPSLMSVKEIELTERVGFVYPVYKFFPPNLLTHFVEEIIGSQELDSIKYLFQICTYNLASSWALGAMERVLGSAGLTVSYTDRVRMADTYVPLFKTPSADRIGRYYEKAKHKVEEIARNLSDEAIKLVPRSLFSRSASKYLMRPIHRSLMDAAEQFAVTDQCTTCGICYRICPSHNIELLGGKPRWDRVCSGCLACYHRCPEHAIIFNRRIRGSHYPNERSGYTMEYR
ncbi:MAG: EFR1 family ferrodoxin [Sphaerochaeta sp.]|jgi:Pyruvate/2-oxoacid:ferredoxin oxidoreductase delta subunit|nr:4Fe-4S ferredoxin [Spirochaetales bacterium]